MIESLCWEPSPQLGLCPLWRQAFRLCFYWLNFDSILIRFVRTMKLARQSFFKSGCIIFLFKKSFKDALQECILINQAYLVLIILSSTDKFSPNVCSSGKLNSLLQEWEGWLSCFSGNLVHILLFLTCLISPLFNKDGLRFAVYLDGMYSASHSKKIRPTQSPV